MNNEYLLPIVLLLGCHERGGRPFELEFAPLEEVHRQQLSTTMMRHRQAQGDIDRSLEEGNQPLTPWRILLLNQGQLKTGPPGIQQ